MKIEDAQKVIDAFRNEGRSDEEILYAFSRLYFDDKINLDGFEGLVNLLGFHLDDDFKKMSKKEQCDWFMGGKNDGKEI